MDSKIGQTKDLIKKRGLGYVIKKLFHNYVFSFVYIPYCKIKIRSSKFKDINDLVDFTFNKCYGYIKPMQVKKEIISLLKLVEKLKPKNVLEVGTANGGTLFLFSRVIRKDSRIITLDLPKGYYSGIKLWWQIPIFESFFKSFEQNGQKIDLIKKDSHNKDTLKEIKEMLGGKKIDFLFIDGDHTYEGVKRDFVLYKSIVRKGGLIAFHDIVENHLDNNSGVSKLWKEIKKKYSYQEIIENPKQNWAGIGVLKI